MNEKHAKDNSWWATAIVQVTQNIGSSANGLSSAEAAVRLQLYGANTLQGQDTSRVVPLLWRQISSPIVLILIAAAILAFVMHDATDGIIILMIVIVSGVLGFWQEYRAASAVATPCSRAPMWSVASAAPWSCGPGATRSSARLPSDCGFARRRPISSAACVSSGCC